MFGKGKNPLYGKHAKNMMKTDVLETDSSYELDVDLPGFKKDEISVTLENGYLTISAAKGLDRGKLYPAGTICRRYEPQLFCRRRRYPGRSKSKI